MHFVILTFYSGNAQLMMTSISLTSLNGRLYMIKQRTYQNHLFNDGELIILADENINEASEYQPHQHRWGQIIFVKCGVVTLEIENERFIAPLGFAIWIPPNYTHGCYNHKPARFRAINICETEAKKLSQSPSLLKLSDIAIAIIDGFFDRKIMHPSSEQDYRKSQVLIDELHSAMVGHTYLPTSQHRLIQPIIQALEHDPSDRHTLKEWAEKVFTTERTLARHFRKELGMSFNEWCQRLRFIHGIALLEQGETIEEIAFKVGYKSASSFIAMFQALSGTTPNRYRQLHKQ